GQYRPVHGHGDGDFVQRNSIEQNFHILNGIDGHPGHAHVSHDPFVIAVVTTVGGEVKGHGKTFLSRCQITTIKRIALLRRRKTCILSYGPRTLNIHGGVGATKEGWDAGGETKMFKVEG